MLERASNGVTLTHAGVRIAENAMTDVSQRRPGRLVSTRTAPTHSAGSRYRGIMIASACRHPDRDE